MNWHPKRSSFFAQAIIGLGLVLLGLAVWGFLPKGAAPTADSSPSAIPVQVEFAAPALQLADLNGVSASLADWRGQVVLVNNWATWCPPCKAEMPTLEAYYQAHHDQGFIIIAIESGEPPHEVADFAAQYRLTFPVWVDEDARALEAFNNWDLPSSYVIDSSGIVRLAWVGPISREMLEKYVAPFLND